MDNRTKFVDFLQSVKGIQDMLLKENEERVTHGLDDKEWDLVEKLVITPTNLQLQTEYTIIEFDTSLNVTGKIRRNKK
jgi:hypothetical protein